MKPPLKAAGLRPSGVSQSAKTRILWKTAFLTGLALLSITARADAGQDQRDIYEVEREYAKPPPGVTVDEQTTAQIKRRMASLLYPVDLSSLVGPDQDARFRESIKALQNQMGAASTGILTGAQFFQLAEAARNIDDAPIEIPLKKMVIVSSDSSAVFASGTGAMDDLAFPINYSRIACYRSEKLCTLATATFDDKSQYLRLDLPDAYDIQTWLPSRVTASAEKSCSTDTLTVDVKTEAVTLVTVFHGGTATCDRALKFSGVSSGKPQVWTLVDGFPVSWKIHMDKVKKAQALVYQPAKRLLANVK